MDSDKQKKRPTDLSSLAEEEQRLLKKKYGLDPSDTADLTRIKKQFDKTRAKIKEIERKARKKLGIEDDPEK